MTTDKSKGFSTTSLQAKKNIAIEAVEINYITPQKNQSSTPNSSAENRNSNNSHEAEQEETEISSNYSDLKEEKKSMSEEVEVNCRPEPEECVGCSDGCPNVDENLLECEACEPVDFCCTLVIPEGFSIPSATPRAYLRDNFDVAAYFDEDCIEYMEEECFANVENQEETGCKQIAVTQIFIQGCIKLIGGVCVASDSGGEDAAQAPVCCNSTVCVPELQPVCLGCEASFSDLRVVGVDIDFVANEEPRFVGESCGDEIWEITGTLKFACIPCPDNTSNCDE